MIAPAQRALEAARHLDGEQHLARRKYLIELCFTSQLPRDLEEFRILERSKDRAPDIARLLQQHRGRQIAWRRVDGVSKQ